MKEREQIIRLWFDMWLQQKNLGIDDIFEENVIYVERWSPKYENRDTVKHWFNEWNTRGKVLKWDIKQYFHKDNQTIVEWYFKNTMNNGKINVIVNVPGMIVLGNPENNSIIFISTCRIDTVILED